MATWAGTASPGWGRFFIPAGPSQHRPALPGPTSPQLQASSMPVGPLPRLRIRPAPGWAGVSPGGPPRPLPRLGRRALSGWPAPRLAICPAWAGTAPPGWAAPACLRLACQLRCPSWAGSRGSGLAGIPCKADFLYIPAGPGRDSPGPGRDSLIRPR
jgi:hypothetical protein